MQAQVPELYKFIRKPDHLKVVMPAGHYPKLFDKDESGDYAVPVLDPLTLNAHFYPIDFKQVKKYQGEKEEFGVKMQVWIYLGRQHGPMSALE